MRKFLLTTLLIAATAQASELPEITVTATRVLVPIEHVGDDVQIITKEEIEKYGFTNISDVLKHFAGINITNNGGPGKYTSVFIMGLPLKHILVLVNGVPINNPSLPDNSADLRFIDLNNVERIEVLKGSQGAIYGSEAIGGVINIITRKPKKTEFSINLEAGKYSTFKESIYGGLKSKNGYLSISSENFKTNGFDAKNSKYTHDTDNDGYRYKTGSINYGIKLSPTLKISGVFNLKGGSNDYDDGKENYDRYFAYINVEKNISESFLAKLKLSNNKEERTDINSLWGTSEYTGITRYISFEPTYFLSENFFISGGASYRYMKSNDTYSGKNSSYIKSLFVQAHSDYYGIHLTGAGRVDKHKTSGSKFTYKFSVAYPIEKTRTTLKGQYGTGFKSPSLYQLYSIFGSPNLDPEKSEGWILGINQSFPVMKGSIELNYFKNRVWNMIDWNPSTMKYKNFGKVVTEGAEIKLSVNPFKWLKVFGTYTHLRAKEINTTGNWEKLQRRPKISYTAGLDASFKNLSISLWADHYSRRRDTYYDPSTWTTKETSLSPFTTLNCYASYKVSKRVKVYLKGFNLNNKDYELAYGYNTMGRAIFTGINISFR